MIVDTSALVAILYRERGYLTLSEAILGNGGRLPAPVLVEFARVSTGRGKYAHPAAEALLKRLVPASLKIEPFTAEDVAIAGAANNAHGLGNGKGGTLNLLDLMVYATARRLGEPILCTGRDFYATGIPIHPASCLT